MKSLLKSLRYHKCLIILLKDWYFHQVETIFTLMNVLAYEKSFTDHTNNKILKQSFIFLQWFHIHCIDSYFDANEFPGNEGQKV